MSAPLVVIVAHNIVTISILGQGGDLLNGAKAVVGVDDLEVSKVASFTEAVVSEATGAHLGGSVLAIGPWVYNLAAPFHHGGVVGQVSE